MILQLMPAFSFAIGTLIFALMLWMSLVSYRENERRAGLRALVLSVALPAPFIVSALVHFPHHGIVSAVLSALAALFVIILFFPVSTSLLLEDNTPRRRFDERDVMFSRRLLVPGTERFREYYASRPEKEALDNRFREKPGLLEKGAKYYDPLQFSAADAGFTAVEKFASIVDGCPAPNRVEVQPDRAARFIKNWARILGAHSTGITELRDYHLYSTVGRGTDYGKEVALDHRFAIAFTVEMDKSMMDHAPYGPTVMETARQYLNAGAIAVQVAQFIRNLGYSARAHIDGNYRVICPLVARDAGLGEIGRLGLLMTPRLGPRVRIAVITTDIPLSPDTRHVDASVIDFCRRCKKCAEVCPSRALPFDDRRPVDGVPRWKLNSNACFAYWCAAGTDCGRCVRVCPYSHPDSRLHNLVRAGNRISPLFREFALKMDDFFYGRKPPPLPVEEWMMGERC